MTNNNQDQNRDNRNEQSQNSNPGNFANDREKASEAGRKGGQN